MNEYKKNLKNKRNFYIVMLIFLCIIVVLKYTLKINLINRYEDFFVGFQVGLIISFATLCICSIVCTSKALNNEDRLRDMYIKDNDERLKAIKEKAGGASFYYCYTGLLLATLIAGYINYVVMLTLLCSLFFIILVNNLLYMYYSRKM